VCKKKFHELVDGSQLLFGLHQKQVLIQLNYEKFFPKFADNEFDWDAFLKLNPELLLKMDIPFGTFLSFFPFSKRTSLPFFLSHFLLSLLRFVIPFRTGYQNRQLHQRTTEEVFHCRSGSRSSKRNKRYFLRFSVHSENPPFRFSSPQRLLLERFWQILHSSLRPYQTWKGISTSDANHLSKFFSIEDTNYEHRSRLESKPESNVRRTSRSVEESIIKATIPTFLEPRKQSISSKRSD